MGGCNFVLLIAQVDAIVASIKQQDHHSAASVRIQSSQDL